ncbi:MAG TPA: DNA alkylation repair protein [Candidatus Cloacimonadota bacterium]|nr:DNA alkylation repair protein [Candidatus Cloacimonadota bacterium]HPS39018.1 DNA alkylation repair protein [Candidatus Cloacimonadota bacterium]
MKQNKTPIPDPSYLIPDPSSLIPELQSLGNLSSAESHAKFFQAYPGGYGEGDRFWGITVPAQRSISKKYFRVLSMEDFAVLLTDPVHEVRLTTLMMMVYRFEKSKDASERQAIFEIYISHADYINNWDLVDCSAAQIVGGWLFDKPDDLLIEFAGSGHLWKQRIAMIATYFFIRKGVYEPTLRLAWILLHHPHDLIHKAVGWMLREMGNRDYQTEYRFLAEHYQTMPRTMLRYAIEKFDEDVRQDFLKGRI